MRILVISDLHANPAALDAIDEPFDACFCLGDLVEYGPEPDPCFAWVRKNVMACVRGNHDHGAAQNVAVQGVSGFRYLTMVSREWTLSNLQEEDRRFLVHLPTMRMLTLGGYRFLLVHASPRDPLDEYMPPDASAWATRIGSLPVDFVLVGHTHVQYQLSVGNITVVNPGSVGLPRDGDPRARYAIIEDGTVHLKQVPYDIDRTIAALRQTPLPLLAKQMLTDIYREGKYIHPPGLPMPVPAHRANGHGGHIHFANTTSFVPAQVRLTG